MSPPVMITTNDQSVWGEAFSYDYMKEWNSAVFLYHSIRPPTPPADSSTHSETSSRHRGISVSDSSSSEFGGFSDSEGKSTTYRHVEHPRPKFDFCRFCYEHYAHLARKQFRPMPKISDQGVWHTHHLRDPQGRVTCPRLYHTRCTICSATGDRAHTTKYCPVKKGVMEIDTALELNKVSHEGQ